MRLIDRARTQGEKLFDRLSAATSDHPNVGDLRGVGMLLCIELVEDRVSKRPFAREAQIAEKVVDRARSLGLLLYPSTGNVDGVDGDYLLLGPPFTVIDDEIDLIVDRSSQALASFL
jgi:hypothetical protein